MKFFRIPGIGALFALHCQDNDFVGQGELFEIGLFVAFLFIELESLREKILAHGFLDFGGVFFLVVDPASELIGVFIRILGQFVDLLHGLGDGGLMGVQIFQNGVIRINAAGNLTMGVYGRSGGKGENGCSSSDDIRARV